MRKKSNLFLTTAIVGLLVIQPAYGQVIILPPLPPAPGGGGVGGGGAAGSGGSAGGAAVGGFAIYVGRGILGTWVIGQTEQRQANGCEFLTWPLHGPCKPGPQQTAHLRILHVYGSLPSVQEKLRFAQAGGQAFAWPTSVKATKVAIKFECSNFAFNRSHPACAA